MTTFRPLDRSAVGRMGICFQIEGQAGMPGIVVDPELALEPLTTEPAKS